jgi:phage portal protein BeeE
MSLLSKSLQTKAERQIQTPFSGTQFQIINGRLVSISDNPVNYLKNGYDINDIVYSILSLIMDKIRVSPWGLYKIKDESAMKAYQGMQRKSLWFADDYRKIRDLRHKAIEPVKDPGRMGELLKYPNDDETMSDFVANGCGYKLSVGNKYIYADILEAGADKGLPNKLINLPAQYGEIEATDSFPTIITGYKISLWSTRRFLPEEIMHEKYWNPNWNINGQQLYGVAPLKASLKILNRDNSSLDSSASRFQNQGISGILHMKGVPGQSNGDDLVTEVKNLKKTMINEWSGPQQTGKMGLSGYDMGWLPIGLTAEEMQQIENEKWNLRRLCNVWGVQSQLLNDPDNKTYANQEEAERSLTTRCAIPALTSFRDNLNRKLQKDWGLKGKGLIADYDASVYTELQQDTAKMVEWLDKLMNRGLPPNRAMELLNLERIDNPIFDEPWISLNAGQPLSEWLLNPVDDALNMFDES